MTQNNEVINQIRGVLDSHDNFIITGHINPDGDCIGSCFALALHLQSLGKKVSVLLESYNNKFNIIPGVECLYSGNINNLSPDVFLCLDCGDKNRLGSSIDIFSRTPLTICIDHHLVQNFFCQINFVLSDASSTSELIYELIKPVTDKNIAAAIYAGILCDTGGFCHVCTNSHTMNIAAELLACEFPFSEIYNELLRRHSLKETQIFCEALNHLSFYQKNKIVCCTLTYDNLQALSANGQEMDGIVEYLLNIRDVEIATLIYEKSPGEIKASIRSRQIDICKTASSFGGGGHKFAAGCTIRGDIYKTLETIVNALIFTLDNFYV